MTARHVFVSLKNSGIFIPHLSSVAMKAVVELAESLTELELQSEIINGLLQVQEQMSQKLCEHLNKDVITEYFCRIWECFVILSESNSNSIKITTYSTITVFLMKMCPFYPKLVTKAFSLTTAQHVADEVNSLMFVASFAFLTKFISPVYLEDFCNETPIFHHFFQVSSLSSERLSAIIMNLPDMGDEWFGTVTAAFVNRYRKEPSRSILSAIAALVGRSPRELTSLVMQLCEQAGWNASQLSIISFLLAMGRADLSADYDSAKKGAIRLAASTENRSALNDSFQVLSALPNGVSISVNGDTVSIEYGGEKAALSFSHASESPSFFKLPLPLKLLKPAEGESTAVLQAKLESLGALGARTEDKEEITAVAAAVAVLSQEPFDNARTPCVLGCVRLCATNVSLRCRGTFFTGALRRLLLCRPRTWFHASEVLRALSGIDPRLFARALGPSGASEVIRAVVAMSGDRSEALARQATEFLIGLAGRGLERETVEELAGSVDFFDAFSFGRRLFVLSELFYSRPGAARFVPGLPGALLEAFCFYEGDLGVVSSIFAVLSYIPPPAAAAPLIDVAVAVIHTAMAVLTGHRGKLRSDSPSAAAAAEQTRAYLGARRIDITDEGANEMRRQLQFVFQAARFLFALPFGAVETGFVLRAARRLFRFFPQLCADFLVANFRSLSDSERAHCLNRLTGQLGAVRMVHVHAQWCRLALFPGLTGIRDGFFDLIDSTSRFFLAHNEGVDAEDLFWFAAFVGSRSSMDELLFTTLTHLSVDRARVFISIGESVGQAFVEQFPHEFNTIRETAARKLRSDLLSDALARPAGERTDEDLKTMRELMTPIDFAIATAERTRPVEEMDLQVRIQRAIDAGRPQELGALLALAAVERSQVKIPPVPGECVDAACDFLARWDPDSLPRLLSQYTLGDFGTDEDAGAVRAAVLDPGRFAAEIEAEERPKKRAILGIAHAISAGAKAEPFYPTVKSLLAHNHEGHRASAVLALAASFAHSVGIAPEFAPRAFDFVKRHREADARRLCKAVYEVVSRFNVDSSRASFVKGLFSIAATPSYEAACIHASLAAFYGRAKKRSKIQMTSVIDAFLDRGSPSAVICALRIATQVVVSFPGDDAAFLLKSALPSIANAAAAFIQNGVVAGALGAVLRQILQKNDIIALQSSIADFFFRILNSASPPAWFDLVSMDCPGMMRLARQGAPLFTKTVDCSDQLCAMGVYPALKVHTEILDEMLARFADRAKASSILTERVLSWLEGHSGEGGYRSGFGLWTPLLLKYTEGVEAANIAVGPWMRHAPSFFVAFVELARVIRRSEGAAHECLVAMTAASVEIAAGESHKSALRALVDGGDMRTALDCALEK